MMAMLPLAVGFDLTIRAGDVLILCGLAATSVSFLYGVNFRLLAVEKEIEQMSGVLVAMAKQEERQIALERRIDDLQHGRGFILEVPSTVRGSRRGD